MWLGESGTINRTPNKFLCKFCFPLGDRHAVTTKPHKMFSEDRPDSVTSPLLPDLLSSGPSLSPTKSIAFNTQL